MSVSHSIRNAWGKRSMVRGGLALSSVLLLSLLNMSQLRAQGEGPVEEAKGERSLDLARSAIGSTLFSVSPSRQDDTQAGLEDRFPALDTSDALYLISDDEVLSTKGKKGEITYLLTINGKHEIDSFSFFNYFGSGTVSLQGLTQPIINKSQQWVPLADSVRFSGTAPVHIVFNQPRQLRAVKVSMNITEEGEFSGFGVAGIFNADQLEKMEIVEVPEDTTLNSVITPSQVSRIAGVTQAAAPDGADPEHMIDDLVETAYEFNTAASTPAVLMDLGQDRKVERITALVTTDKPATMEVYFLSDVEDARPADEVARLQWPMQPGYAAAGSLPFASLFPALAGLSIQKLIYADPEALDDLDPVAVVECPADDPRIVIDLESTYTTRFILIRWLSPDGTPLDRFIVHEINLLGRYNWRFNDLAAPAEGPDGVPGSVPPPDLPPVSP